MDVFNVAVTKSNIENGFYIIIDLIMLSKPKKAFKRWSIRLYAVNKLIKADIIGRHGNINTREFSSRSK